MARARKKFLWSSYTPFKSLAFCVWLLVRLDASAQLFRSLGTSKEYMNFWEVVAEYILKALRRVSQQHR